MSLRRWACLSSVVAPDSDHLKRVKDLEDAYRKVPLQTTLLQPARPCTHHCMSFRSTQLSNLRMSVVLPNHIHADSLRHRRGSMEDLGLRIQALSADTAQAPPYHPQKLIAALTYVARVSNDCPQSR